ncbi:T9SS type A sorting domain-containing protein [candidate division KSB1 bacterium]|nr:T9SS type A sorting domain-containing protein [candidate division KSB1 bacterium]
MKGTDLKAALMIVFLSMIASSAALGDEFPRTLYVLNGLGRTLSKMDLETGEIINDIFILGDVPSQVVAFGEKVYVVNSTPPEIMVINPQNEEVENRIALVEGSNPWFMALVGADRVYVTNWIANTVSVVDLDSGVVVKEIPVGLAPQGILIVEDTAFVTNTGGYPNYEFSSVSIIDILTDSVIQTLSLPPNAQDLTLAPDEKIHVVCSGPWGANAGRVCVIDRWAGPGGTPAVMDTIEIGGWPGDIAITADGKGYLPDWGDEEDGFLYSYNVYTDSIYHGSSDPIRVGKGAMRVLYDSTEGIIYVSNFGDDTVQRFNPQNDSVLVTLDFGDGAQDMTILEPIYAAVDNDRKAIPTTFSLSQNYPNPFNSSTSIRYGLDQAVQVELTIYNLLGQRVDTLVKSVQPPGEHTVCWNGTDGQGKSTPSGFYFYRLKTDRVLAVRRMILIK